MSESAVVRTFETRAVRPLWLATILAALAAAITQHWWSVGVAILAS